MYPDRPSRVFTQTEILKHKISHIGFRNDTGQKRVCFGPVQRCGKGQGSQIRSQRVALLKAACAWGDIRHKQALDGRWMAKRQHHGRFATHRVSDYHGGHCVMRRQRLEDVFGHRGIICGAVGAVAVVAQVERQSSFEFPYSSLKKAEISGAPKQPVQKYDRRLRQAVA
ncbi:hypothetical protein AA23498_0647 [Acetobacter nitrogenifigens DSM 23921 = NBRC 105050]|nr:hypothetical protein AA23498_0647 [Acetobacter nitrogenifigens DSM 23921 = NBRC 105050]